MNLRQIIKLTLYSVSVFALACLINSLIHGERPLFPIIITVIGFWLIALASLIIFNIGQTKEAEAQPLFSLAAVALKFLLSAILALIYFVVLKKTGLVYIILFFVLYLAFTVYLLCSILKRLKTRSLKID